MPSLRRWHNGACGLIFLLSVFATQSIEADETTLRTAPALPADAMIESSVIPKPKPVVVALADPGPATDRAKTIAPTKLPPAAMSTWPAPARFFTINQVLAKHKRSPSVQLAAVRSAETVSDVPSITTPPIRGDEPFGLFTFRAPKGPLWTKWRKVKADSQAEAPALVRCSTEPDHCTPTTARFVAIVRDAKARLGRARLELVNRRINAAIRYTSDVAQWAAPDVWSAPLDVNNKGSFNTGHGDCEDYAIAKYVVLQQAGVATKDLRLLLVRDRSVHVDHAVLAARQSGHWIILDNRWDRLIEDIEAKQFMPLFALNEEGVKLFAAPYAANQGTQTGIAGLGDRFFVATGASIPVSARSNSEPIGIASLPPVM